MLVLLFQHDQTTYALPGESVLEVVPWITPQPIAGAPPYLLGLCQYRGTPTPVVDFAQRVHSTPSASRLSTRLVLLKAAWRDDPPTPLGLVVERALRTARLDLTADNHSQVQVPASPSLGQLVHHGDGFVQLIQPDRLLSIDDRQLVVSGCGMRSK